MKWMSSYCYFQRIIFLGFFLLSGCTSKKNLPFEGLDCEIAQTFLKSANKQVSLCLNSSEVLVFDKRTQAKRHFATEPFACLRQAPGRIISIPIFVSNDGTKMTALRRREDGFKELCEIDLVSRDIKIARLPKDARVREEHGVVRGSSSGYYYIFSDKMDRILGPKSTMLFNSLTSQSTLISHTDQCKAPYWEKFETQPYEKECDVAEYGNQALLTCMQACDAWPKKEIDLFYYDLKSWPPLLMSEKKIKLPIDLDSIKNHSFYHQGFDFSSSQKYLVHLAMQFGEPEVFYVNVIDLKTKSLTCSWQKSFNGNLWGVVFSEDESELTIKTSEAPRHRGSPGETRYFSMQTDCR